MRRTILRSRSVISPGPARSGGAVLIVVLSLMGCLAFLGFFFYSMTDVESHAAQNFAAQPDFEIDPDPVMDHALQQVITHTPANLDESALSGSRWSLLAHVVGRIQNDGRPADSSPHSGRGISVSVAPTAPDLNGDGYPDAFRADQVLLDYNGDGAPDADGTDGTDGFILNFGALADLSGNGRPFDFAANPQFDFEPDAGYTYADLNSLFLSWEGVIQDSSGAMHRVVLPSYFRPQLFPDKRSTPDGFDNLYTAGGPRAHAQVLRPHREHRYGPAFGNLPRYLTNASGTRALSGDTNRIVPPFPFKVDLDLDGRANEMGVFTLAGGGAPSNTYEFDVDADQDGVRDSILLDLDHPLINLPDGRQAVPLFYVKIVDLDGLLNLNAHGNMALIADRSNNATADPATQIYGLGGTGPWLNASNMGLSASEVNPLYALHADPNNAAGSYVQPAAAPHVVTDHRGFYADHLVNPPDISNTAAGFSRYRMAQTELAMLLYGRPACYPDAANNTIRYADSNPASAIPGRHGETSLLRPALGDPAYGPRTGILPLAGRTGWDTDGDRLPDVACDDDGDDNLDRYAPPFPARDNNGPIAPAGNIGGGFPCVETLFGHLSQPLAMPSFVHPLDFTGLGHSPFTGSYLAGSPYGGLRRLDGLVAGDPDNPGRWVQYGGSFWQFQGRIPVGGVAPYTMAGMPNPGYALQMSSASGGVDFDGLLNEEDEQIQDRNFAAAFDDRFPPAENLALHLSDADWRLAGEDSRVRRLASFNFQDNYQAAAIRSQFATESWDRLEHSHSRQTLPSGNRQWEFNDSFEDRNRNGLLDAGEDSNGNNRLDAPRFPPQFGNGITSRHERLDSVGPAAINVADPFRPVLRRLLTVEEGNTTNFASRRLLPGQRLDINRLLVGFDPNGNPIYRRLTPHPVFDGTETDTNRYLVDTTGNVRPMTHENTVHPSAAYSKNQPLSVLDPDIPAGNGFSAVPLAAVGDDPFAQEAWARYDRQRLARDIYVLLYTLCGGRDNVNYSQQSYSGPDLDNNGVPDEIEAMARFAVNWVDALDQDSVITRFEYDPDLSDGWNVASASALVADGVEAQQLSLSEVLWVRSEGRSNQGRGQGNPPQRDVPATIWDDSAGDPQFLYVELRNASPFPVELGDETWRLVRINAADGTREAQVTFRANAGGLTKSVAPGGNFLIATHDGSVTVHQSNSPDFGDVRSSDLYVDIAPNSPDYEAIVPEGHAAPDPDSQQAPQPQADLDLCYQSPQHTDFFTNDSSFPGGKLVTSTGRGDPDDNTQEFILVLERRRNLHATGAGLVSESAFPPTNASPDWVEVDRMLVPVNELRFGAPGNGGGNAFGLLRRALRNMRSSERRQPLSLVQAERTRFTVNGIDWMQRGEPHAPGNGQIPRGHTLAGRLTDGGSFLPSKHAANSRQSTEFTVWQPHFDRDFSSKYELLSIPLCGPDRLIERLADENGNLSGIYDTPTGNRRIAAVAGKLILHPSGNLDNNAAVDPGEMPNRWYRLFEFVDRCSRSEQTVADRLSLQRRDPGRINLNTIRHEHVYAGLIDDPLHLDILAFQQGQDRPTQDRLDISGAPPAGFTRNWYDQFLIARDGLDHITAGAGLGLPDIGAAGLPLPGIPGARPFLGMSHIPEVGNVNLQRESARLLQNTLLRGHLGVPELGLLEARASADLNLDNVDFHTRQRLLSKIANNTTNRSHVFGMWVGFELFEAHQPLPGAPDVIQIGGRLEDLPPRRAFLVVDMSLLEEAYNPLTQTFDFRKFILYRKLLQ